MLHSNITQKKFDGEEALLSDSRQISSVLDYWRWAHSDILDNTERGILAEYIVACALGLTDKIRTEWDKYDLTYSDSSGEFGIEVKCSSYLQSWVQDSYSAVSFGIRQTRAWDPVTRKYNSDIRRQSDLYVFCLFSCKDIDKINPLDLSQWEFYVVPTSLLNQKYGNQKRVSLKSLESMGIEKTYYPELKDAILQHLKCAEK